MSAVQNAPFFVDNEVICLRRNGVWMSDHTEITHEPTRRMFSQNLERIPGSERQYQIKIGRESKTIVVEDTAYFVQRIDGTPETEFKITLNDGTQEILNLMTLKYQPGRLTCTVVRRGFTEEAKFLSTAYMDLLSFMREDESSYYLEVPSMGRIFLAKK